ncbi:hypothetical protein FACS1894202_00820 [Clostridia bacterium]|nr:hypothetical protein FACS1894202_00820 [Clostridia bacterium]
MELIEGNLFAIAMAVISFVAAWATFKTKLTALEKDFEVVKQESESSKIAIAKRDQEMIGIHRRLAKIDDMKLETQLAEIRTELKHITMLLEKGRE